MKKSLLMLALSSVFAASAVSASTANEDPYVAGFEAYAKELGSYSVTLEESVETYAKDVSQTEKKAGYIGKVLPIPQAQEVTDGVYTVVGSMIWHNPANFGLNNNLSFIVFENGVFVFNAGANPALAYSLHQQIKQVTNKPVKWVAVENNQGHAYLGASYWVDVGVRNLYSSSMANQQFNDAFDFIKDEWGTRVSKALTNSARNVSDKFTTFDGEMQVDVGGGEVVILKDFGPGHTPASTSMYIPSRKVLLTGDLGFNERMPVFFNYTDSFAWEGSYKNMMENIPADTFVIPGHGTPADMATIKRQTYDYLVYLHQAVQKVVDAGGNGEEAEQVDQSMYKDRPVFDQAAKNNARHVYNEITGGDF
ncbi:MBL fold metallo-hydrolase [Thiomicrorhabdus sp. zzn3]|uniref:MBL fold metallo-hydrolase n=1 Tax=Thiomicrorhabdus sp. zzn3 TaxID=3039775 RepID=UPI002436FEA9|nr:MBL fold metallo-hydrolase [Thiomicrorhabdus sp. zzn3]MDG6777148.1 MBL fold metallo-hydrolase [Thiomicrorhabdus sp. zzn3]